MNSTLRRLLPAAVLALGTVSTAVGASVRFDFGNGDVDAVTGVAANFVVPDGSALGTLNNTQALRPTPQARTTPIPKASASSRPATGATPASGADSTPPPTAKRSSSASTPT